MFFYNVIKYKKLIQPIEVNKSDLKFDGLIIINLVNFLFIL
jgi:hypothetical protein